MSSSISGQWMPKRPISNRARYSGAACSMRGYHQSGTLMVRPSLQADHEALVGASDRRDQVGSFEVRQAARDRVHGSQSPVMWSKV
jgi:hypothetical protein